MKEQRLEKELRFMVRRHGIEPVKQALQRISERGLESETAEADAPAGPQGKRSADQSRRRRPRLTATRYVSRMRVSAEMQSPLGELAEKFENKTFLPTYGEIRDFCSTYAIDRPASASRASAIPRVFKRLAQLGLEEIRELLHTDAFSGPARLGPIADAIRRTPRRRVSVDRRRDPIR